MRPIGFLTVAIGAFLAAAAYRRFHEVERGIREGGPVVVPKTMRRTALAVQAVALVALGLGLAAAVR